MSINELASYNWRIDVESFARWRAFYDDVTSEKAKQRALERLEALQANWPHHKLGDMPHDSAA